MEQLESLIGMCQAVMRHERPDVRQFGLIGTQKFLSSRNIEEQVANGDGGADGACDLVAAQQFAAGDFDCRAGLFLGGARFEQQAADRSNGRQRFAAEAQRRDGKQIFDIAQLAGGMPFEGEQSIVAQHAAAVIAECE